MIIIIIIIIIRGGGSREGSGTFMSNTNVCHIRGWTYPKFMHKSKYSSNPSVMIHLNQLGMWHTSIS